jgi:hypothetical protein
MSYQLTLDQHVIRLADHARLPVKFEDGVIVPKDPDSPSVREFRKWVEAGNVPEAADPIDTSPNDRDRVKAHLATMIDDLGLPAKLRMMAFLLNKVV